MGSEVAVVVRGSQPVMRLNTTDLDFSMLAKYTQAMRGSEGMPGTLLSYSLGEYFVGSGDAKKKKKLPFKVVANIPNLMFAWRKWEDSRPVQPHVCYPLIGETLPPRSEMGDDDKSKWDIQTNQDGTDQIDKKTGLPVRRDPWQIVAILMMRFGDELYRFETSSVSGKMSIATLITDYAEQGKRHPNELPVVLIDSDKRVQKGTKNKYDAPVFEIVAWEQATAEDFPEGGVSLGAVEDEVVASKGKAQQRSAPKKEVEEEAPAPRRARAAAVVEEDEPAPRRRAAAAREEEEDEPAPRRATRRPAAVEEEEEPAPRRAVSRRPAAVEEDEEEEVQAPRGNRRRSVVAA